jgi:hypothetical protein
MSTLLPVLLVYYKIQASLSSANLQISRAKDYVFEEKRNNENIYYLYWQPLREKYCAGILIVYGG